MSLINQMLQDLDRRQAMAAESEFPPPQVRAVGAARSHREWFWRIFAALMAFTVAWVLWIAYQLQPKPLVTDAAFRAAEAPRRTAPAQPAPSPAALPRPSAQAPTPPSTEIETFRLAGAISTPIPERARPSAPKPAQARAPEPEPRAAAAPVAKPEVRGKPEPDAAAPRGTGPAAPARLEKRDRVRNPAERAEAEFRRAVGLLNQGRVSEAEEGLSAALGLDAAHEPARQALAVLLLERRHTDDARRLLQEGLAINPRQVQFALALARILIERRDYEPALEALARAREGAPAHAELLAMRGTALQRMARHREAVEAYEAAVRTAPHAGAAWLGLALSLDALDRRPEAAEAYRRAATTGTLAAEVRDYAERRARSLQ